MILTETFSGTETPLPSLGGENAIYHQVLTDGRITLWVKRSGQWSVSSDTGASSTLAGKRFNEYYSSITLTDAQIKALPTTGIEVVAAQGANTQTVPTLCFLHLNWVADYDNIGDASTININYAGGDASTLAPIQENAGGHVSDLLIDGASHAAVMPPFGFCKDNTILSGLGQFADDPGPINAALKIMATNAGSHTGNFTGGDAGNTMTVTITYLVCNIVTGELV